VVVDFEWLDEGFSAFFENFIGMIGLKIQKGIPIDFWLKEAEYIPMRS